MRIRVPQLELRACADAFNLAGEVGDDPFRIERDRWAAEQSAAEARAWQDRMQRKLSECPGFVGCRPPGEQSPGNVTVQAAAADEAVDFLRKRFHVGQVAWQKGLGLVIEILPRRKGISKAVARRRLAPIEQFELCLGQ